MARARGAATQALLAFESTYGTAPVSGFVKMPFASASLGSDQPLLDNELLGYGRDPLPPTKDATTSDGDIDIPIDVDAIGYWLKLAFGQPTTTGTTPKTHTFTSGGLVLPSASIEVGYPDVPHFPMFTGCVLDELSFTMERRGALQAKAKLVAQGETPNTATQGGTPTGITLQRFGHFNGSIKRNGVSLGNLVSAEVMYSNNLDRVETIRSDGKIDGADPTEATCKGNIVTRFADTTLITQATNGTPCALEFAWSLGANASLTITAHAVYLPRPRLEIPGPQGIQATFDWQAALATSPARMLTAVLVNTVAAY